MTTLVYPDVLDTYACKCAACRRTCCRNDWDIVVSRQEYERGASGELGPACVTLTERGVIANAHSTGDDDFAVCRMRPDGQCALLSPERLCSWQLTSGSCAGRACDEFPLSTLWYNAGAGPDAHYRQFATVGCEAIVEALLAHEGPVHLVKQEIDDGPGNGVGPTGFDVRGRALRPNVTIDAAALATRPLLSLYPELAARGTEILQDRRWRLDERLVVLAHLMYVIDRTERAGSLDNMRDLLKAAGRTGYAREALAHYRGMGSGANARLTLIARLLTAPSALEAPRRDFALSVLRGLGFSCTEPALDESGVANDPQASERLRAHLRLADSTRLSKRWDTLAGYLATKEDLLENVVVCEFLRRLVPIVAPGVWASTALFVAWYAALIMSLLGSFEEPPTDDALVDCVVRTQRTFVHVNGAHVETCAWMEQIGLASLPGVSALARG